MYGFLMNLKVQEIRLAFFVWFQRLMYIGTNLFISWHLFTWKKTLNCYRHINPCQLLLLRDPSYEIHNWLWVAGTVNMGSRTSSSTGWSVESSMVLWYLWLCKYCFLSCPGQASVINPFMPRYGKSRSKNRSFQFVAWQQRAITVFPRDPRIQKSTSLFSL